MPSPTVLTLEVRQRFAQWFFHRRKTELGLSQEAVAEISGLSRQQIIRIEKGESGTTHESIPGLAKALQVSEGLLAQYAGLGSETSPLDIPVELVSAWRQVPRERQARFLRAVRSMADAVSV